MLEPGPRFLPKRIRACPNCRDRDHVQVIIYGMPTGPPSPREEDRVYFAGCIPSAESDPRWHCVVCDTFYERDGHIVAADDV